jgi:uncharacterized protein YbbC (DUF1343 family)
MKTGIDVCVGNGFKEFYGQRLGLLVNQASVDSNLRHTWDLFVEMASANRSVPSQGFEVKALFCPEHGLRGTREYMEDVESGRDSDSGLPVYSLYGKSRESLAPAPSMLSEIDTVVIDLQDVGTRYYTYIWTMALMMQACADQNKRVVVLDRPNPINGVSVQGTVLSPDSSSFVGLYSIPIRHGMTIGELALMFDSRFMDKKLKPLSITVVELEGWKRNMWFDDTGLPWGKPSPNMRSLETAIVYPGMCLLEGTNVSEGRGTSKPFELFGAPWIDEKELCEQLNKEDLSGVTFHPVQFVPRMSKFKDKVCKGAQLNVSDRDEFLPFLTGLHVVKTIRYLHPQSFVWCDPPYEYEEVVMPFDMLVGNSWLRESIEENRSLEEMEGLWSGELGAFRTMRGEWLIY